MDELVEGGPLIKWGIAERTFPGESESGDLHFVYQTGSRVLMGVVDGLGHGREAAAAARVTANLIDSFSHESLESLFKRCHERLQSTRGAAITIVAFERDSGILQWLGVGNVMAVLWRANPVGHPTYSDLIVRAGIVGSHTLPPLQSSKVAVSRGDTLVLATDGIHHGFLHDLTGSPPPQVLADKLLKNHQRRLDDSLVLVVRYLGETST